MNPPGIPTRMAVDVSTIPKLEKPTIGSITPRKVPKMPKPMTTVD